MMDAKDAEFLKRLKATFRIEADEHVRGMLAGLLELEKEPVSERSKELIETIFREAHSLKGAARSVGLRDIESLCQALENAFSSLKRGTVAFSPSLCDLFLQAIDFLSGLVSSEETTMTSSERSIARELSQKLRNISKDNVPLESLKAPQSISQPVPAEDVTLHGVSSVPDEPPAPVVPPMTSAPVAEVAKKSALRLSIEENQGLTGTVRMSTTRLDTLYLQAEEMVAFKTAARQRTLDVQELGRVLESWKQESAKSWELLSGSEMSVVREWQGNNEVRMSSLENLVTVLIQALEQDQRTMTRMIDEHLESMKSILMLPVSSLMEIFPKIVRDLAHDQGKDAILAVQGSEIEIDKRILDDLKDPFIHLIRNCVDHGIGKPDEREKQHKAPRGTITISFTTKDSRQVEILIADDGSGIDVEKARVAAVKANLMSEEDAKKLNSQEAASLIFESGFSTSPFITDLSGRGLGLAIVREKVEKLGGTISVESRTGRGTTFRMLLPLTLATFRGVLVQVDEQMFVLPARNVERVLRVKKDTIKTVENRETIQVGEKILPMVALSDVLGLKYRNKSSGASKGDGAEEEEFIFAVVVEFGEKQIAFYMDEIIEEQQVMVKSLGRQLKRVRNIAGATVLGNGRVVPVLNVTDLMKSASKVPGTGKADRSDDDAPARKEHLLVADDSITARTLIKNILQAAGYQVTTAVDGADAFMQVCTGDFDLVVSDVDMPRMSGFELTEKIRKDKRLGDLPVVLVTALESRDDREHGIDAGANAYIVKSSFDQSNLLEVIQRLI